GVLNVAYALNLTLVHLEWTAEHSRDENNSDGEKYWQFADWEIHYAAYHSCPSNSSVKQNKFKYDLFSNRTCDQHHKGKKRFTIKTSFKSLFDNFLVSLQRKNTKSNHEIGFTFYSSRTFTVTSSLMDVGVVFETRWWLQHRKLYSERSAVWSGIPISSNYQLKDYFQYITTNITRYIVFDHVKKKKMVVSSFQPISCSPIDVRNEFLIGVHIRHGDVIKGDAQGRIIWGDLYRYIANSAYIPLLILIVNALPSQLKNRYLITIYSEGVVSDFKDIMMSLKNALPNSRCRLSFFLNGRTSETFNHLLRDDIVINALSTFSMATGIFNSRQLKIGPYYNRARVHGMRNYLNLTLNTNHSQFFITQEKQRLIKQRIQYVWQQKQAQQKTPLPLWLDNYSSNYSEDFMLI
ncbi:unnamed protein product, partial [Rotaria magnacalcarata]